VQIKQNFPLRYFWRDTQNAIKTKINYVLIAQLLMVVIRKKLATKKSLASMITIIPAVSNSSNLLNKKNEKKL